MSEFSRVSIRRGTEGLRRSKGFWSGKDVLLNNDDSTIYMLAKKATTQDLLDTILHTINDGIREWVLKDVQKNIDRQLNGKVTRNFFSLQDISSLHKPEWLSVGGVSISRMLKQWQKQGKSPDNLARFLTDEWVAAWQYDAKLYPQTYFGVPQEIPLARLLLTRWDKLDGSMTLETFLQGLWNLAEINMSGDRFLGPGKTSADVYNFKDNYNTLRNGLRADERRLLKIFGYGACLEVEKWTISIARTLVAAPLNASLALTVLADRGLILPPPNVPRNSGMAITNLGWLEPFDRYIKKGSERWGLSHLLVCSNIREPRDIPSNLKDIWGRGIALYGLATPLRRILIECGRVNGLPAFDITPFERGTAFRVDEEMKAWRPRWFRAQGYPEAWSEFARSAYDSSGISKKEVACQLQSLCEWALIRFKSPWDITPLDLLNPHNPQSSETFATFCKRRIDKCGKGGKEPYARWYNASILFKRVRNFISNPGYPGYREGAANPFELINNPFTGKRNGSKTHRSRIATVIHEKLIDVLLDIDQHGKPTFAWAKTQYSTEDSNNDGIWCPSRWTALAFLLLLPPRKKSVRWLDQGLMDEKVFDPVADKMIENTHHLRDYTYENGQTHLQRYGRPSGAIQHISDDFLGSTAHIGLFINTNKTQLWNPTRRNGYELPWPDGKELLASDDDELRQHGLWLRRVYDVLAYQYSHVMEHDPNPIPVGFTDVRGDTDSVSADEHYANLMPRFVPLFRDTSERKQVVRNGERLVAAMPLTEAKIKTAYISLCMETEARLKAEGLDSVSLTRPKTTKGAAESGVGSRTAKFDIHCLRVAGISRLIELGIDPVIVQEFVAGHLTPVMTHHYLKLQPWHVREKIIEAIVNGDFKSAMETFADKVAKGGWDREKAFVGLPRFKEHVANLPEDFTCFSVVKGGICVMGGKGDACNEGGVFERQSDWKDGGEVEFGPVQGGCGNCIYFRTAAFLLQEQTLVLNILLAELRAQARERKELRTKISDVTCKIDEAEGATKKNKFISDKSLLEARIEELNHDMVPRLTEWVNRYIMLKECESQVDDLLNGKADTTALVAPFGDNIGLTDEDLKVSQEMTSDIGLIGRIVEGSRVLGAWGIVIPEDHARFLERGVDRLLRMNGSQHLLLDVPTSERVHGASIMFNALEELIGAEAMQKALDSETPLALSESLCNDVNNFAAALVGAAQKGRLTIQNLLEEGKNCNLITDPGRATTGGQFKESSDGTAVF